MTEQPDIFHSCAMSAFVEVARATGNWPDIEEVRRLAYRWFEEELQKVNSEK